MKPLITITVLLATTATAHAGGIYRFECKDGTTGIYRNDTGSSYFAFGEGKKDQIFDHGLATDTTTDKNGAVYVTQYALDYTEQRMASFTADITSKTDVISMSIRDKEKALWQSLCHAKKVG